MLSFYILSHPSPASDSFIPEQCKPYYGSNEAEDEDDTDCIVHGLLPTGESLHILVKVSYTRQANMPLLASGSHWRLGCLVILAEEHTTSNGFQAILSAQSTLLQTFLMTSGKLALRSKL